VRLRYWERHPDRGAAMRRERQLKRMRRARKLRLIEAFAEARRTRPEAFLLMVGGSEPQVEHYRGMANRSGLEGHCLFTGTVPQPVAKRLMAGADVLTSPRTEGINTPLKIYEQLASGKPLVATRILSHTQVLDDEVCFLAEPESSSFAAGLLAALEEGPRRESVVRGARKLYDDQYSRPAYERKIRTLLEIVRPCAASPESSS
jgi:glycosyltransferase involved in cell wall biosynthesis